MPPKALPPEPDGQHRPHPDTFEHLFTAHGSRAWPYNAQMAARRPRKSLKPKRPASVRSGRILVLFP
jgi:hypothetical protein